MNPVRAQERLTFLSWQITAMQEEQAWLRRFVESPRVDVVLHYWQRSRLVKETSDMSLAEALDYLWQATEDGHMAMIGVEVGGVLISVDEEG